MNNYSFILKGKGNKSKTKVKGVGDADTCGLLLSHLTVSIVELVLKKYPTMPKKLFLDTISKIYDETLKKKEKGE